MLTYAFDIEIFKNFLSVVFVNVENEFDKNTFVVFEDRDDRQKIIEFIGRPITLCGFNNIHFDNILLNALLEGADCKRLFDLAQIIIADDNFDSIKDLKFKKVQYKSIDFKRLLQSDSSLKWITVLLNWPTVQDLPLPYDTIITVDDVPLILSYNENDVLPLIELWEKLQHDLDIRRKVNQTYGVDVLTESESGITNRVFEKLYSKATGMGIRELKYQRTIREKVLLGDCVSKDIRFQSPELSEFLESIKGIEIKKEFESLVRFAGTVFTMAKGGLHSQDKPGVFYSDDDYLIIDIDAASFYPHIMILNEIKPEHLTKDFLDIYKGLIEERLATTDKAKKEILKIVVNSAYGKTGSKTHWFYDIKAANSVTISGQLYMLSLIELLTLRGFEILSANTDGLVARVRIDRKDEYYQTCRIWEEKTNFKLESSVFDFYIRRDVNNYLARKRGDGQLKRKGIFSPRDDSGIQFYKRLKRGCSPNIISKSLANYFVEGVEVEDTISASADIFDFIMSEKSDRKFDIILRNGRDEKLQHTNRYYASLMGGILLKKDGHKEISILAGTLVQIANDIDPNQPFEDYQVNLKYYKDEVMKIINVIEPSVEQLSLF